MLTGTRGKVSRKRDLDNCDNRRDVRTNRQAPDISRPERMQMQRCVDTYARMLSMSQNIEKKRGAVTEQMTQDMKII